MKIPLIKPNPPTIREIESKLKNSYKERHFSNNGPAVQKLTKKYQNVAGSNIVLVNNATSGLTALLMSLNLKGKEVLLPSFTFPATAQSVIMAGMNPVFVDICSDLYMCPEKTEIALKDNNGSIGAILPVFPLGFDIPDDKFRALAEKYNVACVFDAAACFGMKEIKGNVVYSLHITKPEGIGEGGLVSCETPEIRKKVEAAINFGMDEGEVIQWGMNGKMSDFQAAIGLASYSKRVQKKKKREVRFFRYLNSITNELVVPMNWENNYQTFPVLVHENLRNKFKQHMDNAGIGNRIYYKCLHEMSYFETYGRSGDLSMSSLASRRILCLPIYDTLSLDEQAYIIEKINDFSGV